MNVTVIAVIMVVLIVAAAFQKKIPMYLVLMIVPLVSALALGYSITDISNSLIGKMNATMGSAGYLLLFALIYFTMLTNTGMFETLVGAALKPFGNKMNVIILMILTTVLGLLMGLTCQISVTYLVLFPVLLPLYKKFNLRREYAFILVQTALAVMMWLPYSPAIVNVSVVLGCEPMELSNAASKAAICMVPGIIFQWAYMAWQHKRENGTFAMVMNQEETAAEKKENPLARPKLFWPNLIVFLILMVALLKFQMPAYLVFIVGITYMILVNYPNDYAPQVAKAGQNFMNLFLFMVGISIYLAVFTDFGMTDAIGNLLMGLIPSFLGRFAHIILLAIAVVCIKYVPNRVFTLLYPVMVALGAQYGFVGMAMIAPFIINLTLATGSTPMNPPNFLGCSLLEVDADTYFNKAVLIQSITNLIAIATAVIMGIMPV